MSRKNRKDYDQHNRVFFAPCNYNQKALVESIEDNSITVVSGMAGTGKTLMSIQTLYSLYKRGVIDQIIIIRLVGETFGEKIGALPGELQEKVLHCLGPILDNLSQIIPMHEIECLVNQKKIEVVPVSHCRGRSFYKKGILIEEAQNMTPEMILTIATRVAKESHMVFNGDPLQVDYYDGRNGISYLIQLVKGLEDCGVVEFEPTQVRRHELIPKLVRRADQLKRKIA